MKHVPILFSGPMVQAILGGSKTQTRRIIKPQPNNQLFDVKMGYWSEEPSNLRFPYTRGKAKKDDILWVRETWQHTKILNLHWSDENYGFVYRADDDPWDSFDGWSWKPSIFMPKEACRLFLKVTNVRVERLHDITVKEIKNEGVKISFTSDGNVLYNLTKKHSEISFLNTWGFNQDNKPTEKDIWLAHWASLWSAVNGLESWESNPWVWVYDFEIADEPKDFLK